MVAMYRISIVGSGTVGEIVGAGFSKLGYDVTFYDVDKKRVDELSSRGYRSTLNIAEAVKGSDVSFISVPTPTVNDKMDTSYLIDAVEHVAGTLREKSGYHVVVVKSTVLPTTTEKVVIPTLEKHAVKRVGAEIGVCVNPEFLTEIHRSWTDAQSFARDFFSEERIVIGELDKKSGNVVEQLYKPLNKPVFRTDLKTAEVIKYASNCALASRISYWNEIYYVCQKLGVDSDFVARVVGMDARIGKYGTVHGKAFGGTCLPKDLKAFISFSEGLGYEPKMLKAVDEVNERIKRDRGVRE